MNTQDINCFTALFPFFFQHIITRDMPLLHRQININAREIPFHSLFSRSFTGARNNIHGLYAVHKKHISYRARGGKPLRVEHDEKRGGDSSGNRDCTVMSYECHSCRHEYGMSFGRAPGSSSNCIRENAPVSRCVLQSCGHRRRRHPRPDISIEGSRKGE